jgi:hypothetical protein
VRSSLDRESPRTLEEIERRLAVYRSAKDLDGLVGFLDREYVNQTAAMYRRSFSQTEISVCRVYIRRELDLLHGPPTWVKIGATDDGLSFLWERRTYGGGKVVVQSPDAPAAIGSGEAPPDVMLGFTSNQAADNFRIAYRVVIAEDDFPRGFKDEPTVDALWRYIAEQRGLKDTSGIRQSAIDNSWYQTYSSVSDTRDAIVKRAENIPPALRLSRD